MKKKLKKCSTLFEKNLWSFLGGTLFQNGPFESKIENFSEKRFWLAISYIKRMKMQFQCSKIASK